MIPNAHFATVDASKIRDYLLSPSHPVGRFKSAFFRSLGYTHERPEELDAALRRLVQDAEAELDDRTDHGQKYRVAGTLVGPSGVGATVTTVWIVLNGEQLPRFVTAFPGDRT